MPIRQPLPGREQAMASGLQQRSMPMDGVIFATETESYDTDSEPLEISSADDRPLHERIMDDPDLERKIIERLKRRRDYAVRNIEHRYKEWDRVREHMSMYVNLQRAARKGDKTADVNAVEMPFQRSVVVPATYATLHVLLAQILSIYGARKPMFQMNGIGPEDKLRAKIMEVLIDYDARQTQAYSTLYSLFLDALQTGMGVCYDSWEVEEGNTWKHVPLEVPGVPPELLKAYLGPLAFTPVKEWAVKREYNRWRTIDPYRVRKDPRVPLGRLQEGEFFGHQFDASYNYFSKRKMPNGPYFNCKALKEIKIGHTKQWEYKGYDGINDTQPLESGHRLNEEYGDFYTAETMVVELIPEDWDISPSTNPEKYLFTWVEDRRIVRAHPLSNWHQEFPYAGIETDPDFHASVSPGQGELIEGLQRVVNWLYNSHIDNITAVLNNRWIYSPRFVNEMDLDYGGPGENIRLRSEAVEMMLSGEIQDVRQFLFQMPLQDVTGQSYIPAMEKTYSFIQLLTGANDPLSGIPTPTERSATEVQTITAKATDRIAIMTRLMDEMGISPMIRRSISNRQQFTRMERYYRIGGDFAQKLGIENIWVGLEQIQGDFDYEPISGILPEDPGRSAMVWQNILAGAGQIPQLQQPGPDGMMLDFREVFKTIAEKSGATDIDRFFMQVQVQPDEQVAAGAQAGDLAPVQGGAPPQMGP